MIPVIHTRGNLTHTSSGKKDLETLRALESTSSALPWTQSPPWPQGEGGQVQKPFWAALAKYKGGGGWGGE